MNLLLQCHTLAMSMSYITDQQTVFVLHLEEFIEVTILLNLGMLARLKHDVLVSVLYCKYGSPAISCFKCGTRG